MKAVPSPPFNPTAYRLAGLRIVSDLPLAGLIPCRDTTLSGTEISIRRADVPKSLPSIGTTFPNGQCQLHYFGSQPFFLTILRSLAMARASALNATLALASPSASAIVS